VYRGVLMPGLRGRYVFGDFVTGRVWSAPVRVNPATHEGFFDEVTDHTVELRATAPLVNVSSFGLDAAGLQ